MMLFSCIDSSVHCFAIGTDVRMVLINVTVAVQAMEPASALWKMSTTRPPRMLVVPASTSHLLSDTASVEQAQLDGGHCY